jgi:DNA-binding TFAR19-related protein (PDSD5 family)
MSGESSGTKSEEGQSSQDADLKMLNAKKMLELRKRMNMEIARKEEQEKLAERLKNQPSDRDILLRALTDRGDEVLAAAEASYPREMQRMIPRLAYLIKQKKITTISGGELLQFFRSIGMRVSVSTSISVEDHGKFITLGDKLKQQKD